MFSLLWLIIIAGSLLISYKVLPERFATSKGIYKQLKVKHCGVAIMLIAIVVIIAFLLYSTGISWLQFGWLYSLVVNTESTGSSESDYFTSGLVSLIVSIGFLFLLLIIPSLAQEEENLFRGSYVKGGVKEAVISSVIFGLLHMIMGIPLHAALALCFAGLGFWLIAKKKYVEIIKIEKNAGKNEEYIKNFVNAIQDNPEILIRTILHVNIPSSFRVWSTRKRFVNERAFVYDLFQNYCHTDRYNILFVDQHDTYKKIQSSDSYPEIFNENMLKYARDYNKDPLEKSAENQAVLESTLVHSAYNAILFTILSAIFMLSAVSNFMQIR